MKGRYVGRKKERKVPPTFNRRLDFPVLPLDLVHRLVLLLLLLPLSLFEPLLLLLPLLPLVLVLAGLLCGEDERRRNGVCQLGSHVCRAVCRAIHLEPQPPLSPFSSSCGIATFSFVSAGKKKILLADFYSYLRDFQQNRNYFSSPSKTAAAPLQTLEPKSCRVKLESNQTYLTKYCFSQYFDSLSAFTLGSWKKVQFAVPMQSNASIKS